MVVTISRVLCRGLRVGCIACIVVLALSQVANSDASVESDERDFSKLDENEDGRLSGSEAKSVLQFDADGNGMITKSEFLKGRAKDRGDGGKSTIPVDPAPETPDRKSPADPKAEARKRKLLDQFEGGDRWAIVIGINKYREKPVNGPVSGARLLASALQKHCGYTPSRILLLTDEMPGDKRPTQANLMSQLRSVTSEVAAGDTLLVFFSGHGMGEKGKSYLCPIDFESKRAIETAIATDEIREILQECKAAQKVLILDCCHAGGAKLTGTTGTSGEEVGAAFLQARGLLTLASCRKNETALANERAGVFTSILTRGLQGAADFDGNGIVDSDEVYRYTLEEVPIFADEMREGHKQTPVRIIGEDVVGIFALSRPNGPVPPDDHRPIRPKVGDTITNSIGMKLTFIPSGTFPMGSPPNEYRRKNDEPPLQVVTISRKMFMGVYEVTQEEFLAVMGKNPSYFSANGGGAELVEGVKTRRLPVEQVTWDQANEFCRKLSELPEELAARRRYRLPTEAEWEFACRANTTTVFQVGDLISSEQANIRGDKPYLDSPEGPTLGRTARVGSYKPNAFGLYDMHGNVAEWCQDWYTNRVFASVGFISKAQLEAMKMIEAKQRQKDLENMIKTVNPEGPLSGDSKVIRGGSYTGDVAFCRSAARRSQMQDARYRGNGFRVVCYFGKSEDKSTESP